MFLESQGLFIKERNYPLQAGRGRSYCQRRGMPCLCGSEIPFFHESRNAWEAVDKKKQKIISKVAAQYLAIHFHTLDIACRFDVVGFEKDKPFWIKNAFDFCV